MNLFKDAGAKNGEQVSVESKLRGIHLCNYLGVVALTSSTADYWSEEAEDDIGQKDNINNDIKQYYYSLFEHLRVKGLIKRNDDCVPYREDKDSVIPSYLRSVFIWNDVLLRYFELLFGNDINIEFITILF